MTINVYFSIDFSLFILISLTIFVEFVIINILCSTCIYIYID